MRKEQRVIDRQITGMLP